MSTERTYTLRYKGLTLSGGILTLLLLVAMAVDQGDYSRWETYQRSFRDTLLAQASTSKDSAVAEALSLEIRQISLEADSRVDRCITCHLATVLPGVEGLPQPFLQHPGDYLRVHSVERFGCTLCHRGDGRDVRVQAPCTAGRSSGEAVESLRYIESSCGRCHTPVFERTNVPRLPVLELGRDLVHQGGCLGCHKLRTVGGTLGPDLTELGGKSINHYSFQNVSGHRSIPTWLREHFRDPGRISPGSVMPPVSGSSNDIDALVTFMLSLHPLDLPARYYSLPVLAEMRGDRPEFEGSQAYALLCRACHGSDGQGAPYDSSGTSAPALGSIGFQAIASDDLIQFTLMEGRGKRMMASWTPVLSGLKSEELGGILRSLRRWRARERPWERVRNTGGSEGEGSRVYTSNCSPCHGGKREGGIGPGLASEGFLLLASDRFIYTTVAVGRRNTAMPSWSHLSDGDLHSLLLFLRGRSPDVQTRDYLDPAAVDRESGAAMFGSYCSRCHGAHGEGGIGPAILNRDFQAAADDAFLAGTILQGRAHTPMFAWSQAGIRLSKADVGNLIGYMRTAADSASGRIYAGAVLGRPQRGRELYREFCRECHGEAGEGPRAPALNNQEFLNAATNGYLLATITLGRRGTAMPAWGQPAEERRTLSQNDRLDLVAYLRVWQTEMIERVWLPPPSNPSQGAISAVESHRR